MRLPALIEGAGSTDVPPRLPMPQAAARPTARLGTRQSGHVHTLLEQDLVGHVLLMVFPIVLGPASACSVPWPTRSPCACSTSGLSATASRVSPTAARGTASPGPAPCDPASRRLPGGLPIGGRLLLGQATVLPAELALEDLAAGVLGECVGEDDVLGALVAGELLAGVGVHVLCGERG